MDGDAMATLYDTDFYAWSQEQASLLKLRQWDHLDVVNLIEEIETLGRQERQELRNRFGILVGHLLKWQLQPQNRSNSWRSTLREQRRRIALLLSDSPSLKPYLEEAITIGYEDAKDLVIQETNVTDEPFPEACPYSLEQILSIDFFPEE
jgi:Domain of unknown function DUF29